MISTKSSFALIKSLCWSVKKSYRSDILLNSSIAATLTLPKSLMLSFNCLTSVKQFQISKLYL